MIHVGRLAPTKQWDQNILDELFANRLYPTGLQFTRTEGYPNAHGCVLLIPGRYWVDHYDTISDALATYKWVLAFRTSDEKDTFDIHQITHPNIRWWVQTPRTGHNYDARLFGVGFPAHFNRLPADALHKSWDVFLSAQRTHTRRDQAFDALEHVHTTTTLIEPTPGFTQGMTAIAYVDAMIRTKTAPAPAGVFSPDTFRLFEALESHAVPIADDVSPVYDSAGYWQMLFPDAPFPILTDYADLPAMIESAQEEWPGNANRIAAWWIRQKRRMAHWLREDLEALGAL